MTEALKVKIKEYLREILFDIFVIILKHFLHLQAALMDIFEVEPTFCHTFPDSSSPIWIIFFKAFMCKVNGRAIYFPADWSWNLSSGGGKKKPALLAGAASGSEIPFQ